MVNYFEKKETKLDIKSLYMKDNEDHLIGEDGKNI